MEYNLFSISIVFFKVSLSILSKLLIAVLFYSYNILSKIEHVLAILQSKGSPHELEVFWLCMIIKARVCDK